MEHLLTSDRRRSDPPEAGGGFAAYMGTADYYEGTDRQESFRSEEVATVGSSFPFMIPVSWKQDFNGGSMAYMGAVDYTNPLEGYRSDEVETVGSSFPFMIPTRRRFMSRGDTGVAGIFSTEAGNCAGSNTGYAEYEGIKKVGSFSGLKHSKLCEGNEEAMMRQCAKEEVGSMPVRFEEGRRRTESAFDLPSNVAGNTVSLAAAEATYDDVIDLMIEDKEVEELPYSADEDCDIPITGAATEIAIAQSNIEGRSGGVDRGKISNESRQASADTREEVSSHEPSPSPRRNRNIWDIGDRYRFVRTLGHGSYGEVAQCEDLEEGGYVAIKRILNVFESEVKAKRIYREIFILRHIKHPDIINLKNIILPTNYENFRDLYLVFEFVDTDLDKLIESPQFLTDDHIKLFLYQMLNGLKFVHSTHVIHRDMKPANILLNKDCSLKICDFGLSRVVPEEPPNDTSSSGGGSYGAAGKRASSLVKQSSHVAGDSGKGKGRDTPANEEPPVLRRTLKRQLTKHVVTRWYRAPELILLQDYDKSIDVWSVGCIFAELLSKQEGSFSPQEQSALFPGKSCFPLSAEKHASYPDDLDQLNVIFDVIGTPSAEDIKGLSGNVRKYLKKLKVKPAIHLGDKFKGASYEALELLRMMLRFDPQKRITVDEALEHPYLASCRTRETEVTARVPITMEVDDIDIDKATLKRLVYEEVLRHGSSKKRPRSDEGQEAGDGSSKSRRLK